METANAVSICNQILSSKIELSDFMEVRPTQISISQPTIVTFQESIRALKLPKIELRKFGGEIKD